MSKKNDLAVTPRPVEGTAVEKKYPTERDRIPPVPFTSRPMLSSARSTDSNSQVMYDCAGLTFILTTPYG